MSSREWDEVDLNNRSPVVRNNQSLVPPTISAPIIMIFAGIAIAYIVIVADWLIAKI